MDDLLIRVERILDLDSEGQLVASVLSKKVAAGSTHLIIDVPVGPTAKVRGAEAAERLSQRVAAVAKAFGIETRVVLTDGTQPVGRGIGPALEAMDILAVLRQSRTAPKDLEARACLLAGELLELAGRAFAGEGAALALETIRDGRAWAKFQRICEAQGGMRVPPIARQRHPLLSPFKGSIRSIDNRKIARLAKLAGAPNAKAAGVELHVSLGDQVAAGDPLCTVHANSRGELQYALDYAEANQDLFDIGSAAVAEAPAERSPVQATRRRKLHEQGVRVAMLTGDNAGTAGRIAGMLGIDIVLADVLPGQKADKIKELQSQDLKVGMVGDGVNDAPALTQADVGFAIGAGTDDALVAVNALLLKRTRLEGIRPPGASPTAVAAHGHREGAPA